MKRKEVEDVLGGEGAWDNVDQTDGKFFLPSRGEEGRKEGCNGG